MRVDLRFLNTDIAEQLGKSAARLATQGGKDLRERSDQSLRPLRQGIEVP
jgi:hypothetical protein